MVCQEKETLRAALRKKAAGLPAEYLAASDAGILQQVRALPAWQNAQTVFCYVSVRTEPDTRALLQEALEAGKTVCVPRCCGKGEMHAYAIASLEELRPAPFGLLEPDGKAPAVSPEELDVVIAPCVACDEQGHRLGNGGGFYDRYLARVSGPVVCLCRGVLLQKSLPCEDFDVPVACVVTENGLFPQNT